MLDLRFALGGLLFCLLAGWPMQAQLIYFNTSSAILSSNTLDSVATNGIGKTTLLTATGIDFNKLNRCTALAVDGLNGKLFLIDGAANSLWSVNLDGSGLALVKSELASFPTDLALDVLNETIYYTTSSTIQSDNTVRRMDYTGNNQAILFTGTGAAGNGVFRCTAIAVDVSHARLFVADAGAQTIWSLSLNGTSLTPLATATTAVPTGLALDVANQQVYFTLGSTVQNANLIQRVSYSGSGRVTLFTAAGSVQRCTALDLDVPHSAIYLSDAGANTLWRIPLAGGSATPVLSGLNATAKKVRWFSGPTTRPSPGFTSMKRSGTDVILNATNVFAGGAYYVLTSTNLTTPLSQWLAVFTNVLGASGSFTFTATNALASKLPRQFYILRVQ